MSRNMKTRKKQLILILMIPGVLLFGFQNCSSYTSLPEESQQKSLVSGDPYTGILAKSGEYAVLEEGFSCNNSTSNEVGQSRVIRYVKGQEFAEVISSCSQEIQLISIKELKSPRLLDHTLLYNGEIYQFQNTLSKDPTPKAPVTKIYVLQCASAQKTRDLNPFEFVIFKNLLTGEFDLSIFGGLRGQLSQQDTGIAFERTPGQISFLAFAKTFQLKLRAPSHSINSSTSYSGTLIRAKNDPISVNCTKARTL